VDLHTYFKKRPTVMNYNLLLTFLLGMIVLAATPGPGVFGSMAKAAAEGFKISLFFIGGLVLGDSILLALALLGLSALAKLMGGMFLVIQYTGGLYLAYLGIRMFRSSSMNVNTKEKKKEKRWQTCLSGMLLSLGNPKPILFYASVLPTIINFNEVRISDALLMMVLIGLVSFSVVGTYSYIASLTHKIQMNEAMQKRTNQAAGIVMMVVGVYVMVH
jgi:threonine/homoserine/homoserine lactone efflux protein